jgi:hypothetical protein
LIPDQRFENPDGTEIAIAHDYFGTQRNLNNPIPGPFAMDGGKDILLQVWPKE